MRVRKANEILDLSWSPDGSFFAYVDAMNRTAPVSGLSVLRASDGETIPVTDGRWTDWSPTWSPDSRTLFFVSNRGGSNDLWQQALGPDGRPVGDPQPVTTAVGMRTAAFSPDGVFTENLGTAAYFSLVTQTTLGYGDIVPAEGFPRMVASLQAVIGQLFLVTTVARLVSLQVAQSGRGTGRPAGGEHED